MTALTQPTQVSINIHYAKTHLSRLVEEVASTGQAITIAKAGKPKVMIVPIEEPKKKPIFGFMLDENGHLPQGFAEFDEKFDNELNDEMVALLLNDGKF